MILRDNKKELVGTRRTKVRFYWWPRRFSDGTTRCFERGIVEEEYMYSSLWNEYFWVKLNYRPQPLPNRQISE
jgi:hypothetical protein